MGQVGQVGHGISTALIVCLPLNKNDLFGEKKKKQQQLTFPLRELDAQFQCNLLKTATHRNSQNWLL